MRKTRLLANTALLSASSLLMSGIALLVQVWLARRLGAAGLGLVQLVASVCALAATLAISGVRFASTRLIAEELGHGRSSQIPGALRRCLAYAAVFGAASAALLFACAGPIGRQWIGDARTVSALRLSAFSLPCVSLCAAASGYFTAVGRLLRVTLIHLAEQLLGVLFVALLLRRAPDGDLAAGCAAVSGGRMLADLAALLLMLLALGEDCARHFPRDRPGENRTRRLVSIALPLAFSAYARSGLNTAQHLLIPRGLRAAGYRAEEALAGYGVVHGLVLPALLFPSCLLASAAELMVPELTLVQARRDAPGIRRAVRSFLGLSLLYAVAVAAALFLAAGFLGRRVFHSAEAARYLRLLTPLVPVMYLDMCVDGCLKGLGQQLWSMGVNVVDSLTGLVLVLALLPRYALEGYLFTVFFTETLNFLLSAGRLYRCLRSGGVPASSRRCGAGSARCAYTADRSAANPPLP
ncbi:MAG: oligosaccharide flippase family protein [Oscillospiraceae bacterium]|nr:oligosaccharide flippase family protein [Oscillospiraceae bacterium]